MKTLLQFKNRTPALSDGFYHADSPHLFAQHDTITSLADCPFPLKTDSFKVIAFGTSKSFPDDKPEHGHSKRFAVVEYVKACGHLARERISFVEGVKTFDHYGTTFTGESYSIADWENRIEKFRNYPCEVCAMIRHAVWIWSIGEEPRGRAKAIARCIFLLDANFLNWREFETEAQIAAKFEAIKRGSA